MFSFLVICAWTHHAERDYNTKIPPSQENSREKQRKKIVKKVDKSSSFPYNADKRPEGKDTL